MWKMSRPYDDNDDVIDLKKNLKNDEIKYIRLAHLKEIQEIKQNTLKK